jgi:hypothetical protein
MTIIQALRTYLAACPTLVTGALLLVDHLGETPIQYAIIPQAGEKVIETDIIGNKTCEFPFLFRSMESTADDLERIETAGFYEALAAWFDTQTRNKAFPALGAGKVVEKISANGWGYLYEEGQSQTGVYQISCTLTYRQLA